MNEISLKVQDKVIDEFYPIALQLRQEGKSDHEIAAYFQAEIKKRSCDYYRRQNDPERLSSILKNAGNIEKADSKAEVIFIKLLTEHKIDFKFQYKIGQYRADFLVNNFLVVELDGPMHCEKHDQIRDKYMRKMGFKILRVPLFILTSDPTAIIEEIKYQSISLKR